jgi:hypothetical protein
MVQNGLNDWLWLQEKRLELPLSVHLVDQRSPDVSRVDDTKTDVRYDTHSQPLVDNRFVKNNSIALT